MTTPSPDPSTELTVLTRPGTVPPARPGNVAYFANLSCLFFDNDELTEELRQRVSTLSSYGGRLLPIICLLWSGDRNLLVMERLPLDLIQQYFRRDLRLKLPRLLTFDPHLPAPPEIESEIRRTPACHLD
nr:hypothetical protein [Akkermansiaceae bacterium]